MMDDNILLTIVLLFVVTVVALIFLRRGKKKKEKREEKVVVKPEKFSFKSVAGKGPAFRCPSKNCRAYFSEPRIIIDYMVNSLPKKTEVCPKCGIELR